jgi:hypothetical protein
VARDLRKVLRQLRRDRGLEGSLLVALPPHFSSPEAEAEADPAADPQVAADTDTDPHDLIPEAELEPDPQPCVHPLPEVDQLPDLAHFG